MIDNPLYTVLLPVLINLVTGRVEAKVFASGLDRYIPGLDEQIERWQQRQPPLNHDVEKELRRSLFLALKQLAVQCQKPLEVPATYYRRTPSNQAAYDLEWLKAKVGELEQVIDKVDAIVDREQGETSSQLSYSGDIRALFEGQNLQDNPAIQAFQQQYLPGLNLEDAPPCYQEAIAERWLPLIRDNFVQRLKHNDDAYKGFVVETEIQLQIGQDEIKVAIDALSKQFGETLEAISEDVSEILARLDPQHPELNQEEWATVAKLRLAEEQALTSNLFTREDGVELNRLDVYVPLGLVERRKPERVPIPGDTEEESRNDSKQETITPISEDRFFTDVLQQGKSPQSKGKRLAIIGEPGSGKTTRLQAISRWILDKNLGLPIWVSLRTLQGRSLGQYLDDWLNDATGKPALKDNFQQQFNQGRVWLLLDGLDEMTAHITRDHQDLVKGWWTTGQTRILITCRVNVWDANRDALNRFDVFRNLDFSQSEVENYIERWFQGAKDAEGGQALCSTVQSGEHSHLQDLIRNPLRLSLLCCVWHQQERSLPETRAGLYENFVKQVYKWKSEIALAEEKRPQLHQKLGELALRAIDGKDKEGNFSQFWLRESSLKQVFGALDNDLCQAALRLGWLNRLGKAGSETVYGFYHATFQEYFAALAVEDGDYFLPQNHEDFPVAGKEYRIFAPQWKQVILLWLGRGDVVEEKKEAFIGQLVDFDDGCGEWNFERVDRGFYSYRAYFIAAAGISEFKTYSRADEIVQQIVKWGFGYFNEDKQEWRTFLDLIETSARDILPETDRQRAIETLSSLLNHSQCPEDTRREVAKSLGKIGQGNQEEIAALVQLLEQTEDKYTRRRAAESLGKIDPENQEAIAALVPLIEQTENEYIRREAAQSLWEIDPGNPQAIAALVQVLVQAKDKYTSWLAAYSLGKIDPGNQEAIAALVQVLERTEHEYPRRLAAYSLGKIDPGNQEAIAALVQLLVQTENGSTCWQAAETLWEIDPGNQEAIAALIQLLEPTEDKYTRWEAAQSLGKIGQGNPQAIAALVQLLVQTEDEYTRWQAAETLWEIDPGNQEAIAALVQLLVQTEDEYTRWLAAESLEKIGQGNQQAIAALVQLLVQTENGSTCWQAAETLGKIDPRNPQAIAALVKLLEQTEDKSTRWRVACSLGKIDPGNPQAIAALVKLLEQTEDEYTRWLAAESLGTIDPGNAQAIAALVQVLEQTEHEWVAYSLGKIDPGNAQAIATLEQVLEQTKDEYTRWQVAESLEEIDPGNQEAIAALVQVLEQTEDEDTSWLVTYSLGQIITTEKQQKSVVSALQPHLNPETHENNGYLFHYCYEVLWNIAQTLSYPDFYEAWHGSLPSRVNLAEFPQLLRAALPEPHPWELLIIDGSTFNRDNPVRNLYRQMLQQGCPESEDGKPKDMADLQDYWEDLLDNRNPPLALIFYENPQPPAPQGFSDTFLEALTRFQGKVCVVTEPPHPPLQTFSPDDPRLIERILEWLYSAAR